MKFPQKQDEINEGALRLKVCTPPMMHYFHDAVNRKALGRWAAPRRLECCVTSFQFVSIVLRMQYLKQISLFVEIFNASGSVHAPKRGAPRDLNEERDYQSPDWLTHRPRSGESMHDQWSLTSAVSLDPECVNREEHPMEYLVFALIVGSWAGLGSRSLVKH